MIWINVFFSLSENLEVIRRVTSLLSPSKYMQFCNEQIRTQPLFSPPCASATYGSARMCRRKNIPDDNFDSNLFKIVLYAISLKYFLKDRIDIESTSLQWRHNGRDGISNYQPHDCLLNRLFRRRSKKSSKLRVTGLCAGNSPLTREFPAEMVSNAENVSWRHHAVWTYDKRLAETTMAQFAVHTCVTNVSLV